MTKKHQSPCDRLGICQAKDASPCPNCTPRPPAPQHPFAPGVIEHLPSGSCDFDDADWPMPSASDILKLLAAIAALGLLAGYLVERFA